MISSTRIRELLERGEIEQATDLLGGYHQICGIVVQGDQRGRQIGFPTANLAQIEVVIPAPGVYAGIAHVNGVPYTAAIHLGPRPTFEEPSGDGPRTAVEVHLLDYTGNLYGQTLTVDVITHVRDIARFDSADALATQLTSDVKTVRERIATLGPVR